MNRLWTLLLSVSLLLATSGGAALAQTTHGLIREHMGICDVLLGGTSLTSTTMSAAISLCNSQLGSNYELLLTPGLWTITGNLSIPDTITLRVPKGTFVSINSGITLTVYKVIALDPEWWGGAGNLVELGPQTAFVNPFVQTGCSPVVPASGLTLAPFACDAFVAHGLHLLPVTQAAVAVPVPNSPKVYVAVHRHTTQTVTGCAAGNWTRVGSTHYLTCATATIPAHPVGGVVFAEVTVTGGNVTKISATAASRAVQSTAHGTAYNARDFGMKCDNLTDDSPAIMRTINAAVAAGVSGVYLGADNAQCLLGSTITMPSSVIDWLGGGVRLRWSGPAGGTMLDASNVSGVTLTGLGSNKMTLRCDGVTQAGTGIKLGAGIQPNRQSTLQFINVVGCTVRALDGGAGSLNHAADTSILNCEWKFNAVGMYFNEPVQRIHQNYFASNSTAIIADANAGVKLTDTLFTNNDKGLHVGNGAQNISCKGCYFEGNPSPTAAHLYMPNVNTDIEGSITFIDTEWQSANTDTGAADGVGYFLDAGNMTDGSIVFIGGNFSESNPNGKTFRVGAGTSVLMLEFDQDTPATTIFWTGVLGRCTQLKAGLWTYGCLAATHSQSGNVSNLILPNDQGIRYRNTADVDSLNLIRSDTSNNIQVGHAGNTSEVRVLTGIGTFLTNADIFRKSPLTTAPAQCAIGDFYVDTSGAACACSAVNTWTNMHAVGSCS